MPARKLPTLLLTRPRPDSQRFADMVPGFAAIISPILRIVPVDHYAARLHAAEGLVFTSGHAIASAGPGRGRPALCVGPRTAERARQAGFDVTEGATGEASGLLPLIAASDRRLIHPHGRHVARELPVEGVVVYDQQPLPLTAQAQDLLAGTDVVLLPLFSPRSAMLLSRAARHATAPLWIAGISRAAIDAWDGPAARTRIAARPDACGLVGAIRRLTGTEPC